MEIKIKTKIVLEFELIEEVNELLWETSRVDSKTYFIYNKVKEYVDENLEDFLDETKITWEIV